MQHPHDMNAHISGPEKHKVVPESLDRPHAHAGQFGVGKQAELPDLSIAGEELKSRFGRLDKPLGQLNACSPKVFNQPVEIAHRLRGSSNRLSHRENFRDLHLMLFWGG